MHGSDIDIDIDIYNALETVTSSGLPNPSDSPDPPDLPDPPEPLLVCH